jgi:hypothetical protein
MFRHMSPQRLQPPPRVSAPQLGVGGSNIGHLTDVSPLKFA